MVRFLVNLNIGILLICAIIVTFLVVEDITLEKRRVNEARVYFAMEKEFNPSSMTKEQRQEIDKINVSDIKRIKTEDSVRYEYKIYVPSHLKKWMHQTMNHSFVIVELPTY